MIEVVALSKRYGRLAVLQGLDLKIAPGRVTAVVGHNGSGKTTLIKTILGLVRPDAGRVLLDGEPIDPFRYRARIGYMPQSASFPENLTAREVLALLQELRGPGAETDESLVDAFGLRAGLDRPLRTLSGGTRQKVSAALAFLFRPDVLILDEPTAGLDPGASALLKDRILEERGRGRTILLTSHVAAELEELSDEIVFLLDGRVGFNGRMAEMKRATGHDRLERALAHLMDRNAA